MSYNLTEGAIERIIKGEPCDKPLMQIISSKKITVQGSSADRYRLLLSDGRFSYSHAMLATQLNEMMETGEMDNLCAVCVHKHLCNTIQQDRHVMILLEVEVIAKGGEVQQKIGNPQPYKPGETTSTGSVPSKPDSTTESSNILPEAVSNRKNPSSQKKMTKTVKELQIEYLEGEIRLQKKKEEVMEKQMKKIDAEIEFFREIQSLLPCVRSKFL